MTPETRQALIAAYKRIEGVHGGYAIADHRECVRLAGEECGVGYEDARSVLIDSPLFAGAFGTG